MKVYFLSGLGADKTVFQFLQLSFCEPVFIEWIPPQEKETLEHYASRLKEQFIPDEAIIVGLSFGGMLATEIAKSNPAIKAILVSSAKTKNEIPVFYKTGKYFPVYRWLSGSAHQWFMLQARWMFGVNSDKTRKVFETIISKSSADFNKWAVRSILFWENDDVPKNIVHIHGTTDKVLPYKNVKADLTVKGGEHFMVMEQAEEISRLLKTLVME